MKKKKSDARGGGFTVVDASAPLPLTCSRSGACCHGKDIRLNPWELRCLSGALGVSPRDFRARYACAGGVRLAMSGAPGYAGLPACALYAPGRGCTAHPARPLACRLYPLGTRRAGDTLQYVYEGRAFPCLAPCPEVAGLPALRLEEYLAGQAVCAGQGAQAAYLELVQDLAEGALVLLLDTPLKESAAHSPLADWKRAGALTDDERARRLGDDWLDALTIPEFPEADRLLASPAEFAKAHHARLQERAQAAFGGLRELPQLRDASGLMLTLSLHLGRSLGMDGPALAQQWCAIARKNGARG